MRKSKKCHLLLTYGYQGYLQHGLVKPIQDVSKLPTNPVHWWAGVFYSSIVSDESSPETNFILEPCAETFVTVVVKIWTKAGKGRERRLC